MNNSVMYSHVYENMPDSYICDLVCTYYGPYWPGTMHYNVCVTACENQSIYDQLCSVYSTAPSYYTACQFGTQIAT